MYFYFKLIPNFNSGRVKKNKQMIQLVDKQIHKLIFGKKSIKKKRLKKKSKNIEKKLWQRTK